ncbi:hypothetical protein [Pseudomonas sp. UM16]|uniref:hypothetical protein n=1 Tax=Pseudomonas sp. UM16 TaxID=3158962 RepID=UPI00398F9336
MNRQAGLGLLEMLLALSLGVLLVLGASRLFVAAVQSWQAQAVAAQMQEDARLALQRLTQSIRMTGMFGCLHDQAIVFLEPTAAQAFTQPLRITRGADGRVQRLSLISAEVAQVSGRPDWTLITDCHTHASVHAGDRLPEVGQFALPIRRQDYRLVANALHLRSGGSDGVLVDGVDELQLELLRDSTAGISGMRLGLILIDPQQRVRPQRYRMTIALGNPVTGS